ncbi:MAG: T9SS type A sorting domain-containing protein [Bacteroidales bacterium]|nr:T9SS type A sorting domain-containing protein [Bacteroidales bacterium]
MEGEATISVVDMNGREVFSTNANETLTIDLTGYAKGAYFVRITGERTQAIRKLVVK